MYVWGPSGIGKTEQIKTVALQAPTPKLAEDNVLFVTMKEDLRRFNPILHKTILFDDVNPNFLSGGKPSTREDYIKLLDQGGSGRTFDVKYGAVTIPPKKRKVIISNLEPDEFFGKT